MNTETRVWAIVGNVGWGVLCSLDNHSGRIFPEEGSPRFSSEQDGYILESY